MAVETVTALNEVVSSVHQCISLHTCILHSAGDALTVSLLGPIWALVVVKGLGAHELAVENLGFLIDMIFNLSLMRDIEFILAQGKIVIPDFSLCFRSVCWHESLFVNLAEGLTKSITHDVPVSDLLVDSRIED